MRTRTIDYIDSCTDGIYRRFIPYFLIDNQLVNFNLVMLGSLMCGFHLNGICTHPQITGF